MRRRELISWLERFAGQLRSGTLLVDGRPVRAPEELRARIKSKAKKRRRKLSLKLEWEEAGGVQKPLAPREAPAEPAPPQNGVKAGGYRAHVLVCCGGDCRKRGSKELKKLFKREFRSRGMRRVRVNEVDCLGLCKRGPNAVIYPDGSWHTGVGPGQVPGIVARHVSRGETGP
ncbi:(2Fe-2S) ferredoxin domain-containing protein [Rubrobacter taiwanensis]|jgi:amphi-Trp domain-containing protein|uniref:(2Fe-2S) ferredoxin domain-containing protein n=1 Tax=Rubrobacter taiwanensis TaxID=185139 RepID=A0A4R1BQY8_9ACTN|nr:(2Fe-2S) ferredoxin domain-containing protein [Rubrobacter taiwanensis]TCJ19707.1 (2Fe-2S) ferredoxin domain-containing protein [Rubrobacter taiwanensis]